MSNPDGRPPFEPTQEQRTYVRMAVIAGFVHEDIVKGIINPTTDAPIDGKTLRKHFRHELDAAAVDAGVRVAGRLYKNAVEGDTTALIWYTKARLGWTSLERQEHLHTLEESVKTMQRRRQERAEKRKAKSD